MENQTNASIETQEPEFLYRTHGTCSRVIKFDIDDEQKVRNTEFIGGCNGNAKGIASLIEGMPADWVIERCAGTAVAASPRHAPTNYHVPSPGRSSSGQA